MPNWHKNSRGTGGTARFLKYAFLKAMPIGTVCLEGVPRLEPNGLLLNGIVIQRIFAWNGTKRYKKFYKRWFLYYYTIHWIWPLNIIKKSLMPNSFEDPFFGHANFLERAKNRLLTGRSHRLNFGALKLLSWWKLVIIILLLLITFTKYRTINNLSPDVQLDAPIFWNVPV